MRARLYGGDLVRLLRGVPTVQVTAIVVLSALGGICEAALLMLIVRVGTSAISDNNVAESLFWGDSSQSLATSVSLGVVAGALALVCQIAAVHIMARAAATRMTAQRVLLTQRFFASSIAQQQTVSAGRLQELLSQHVTRSSEGLLMAGQATAAWTNLLALLAAALIVNPATSAIVLAVAASIGALFQPMSRRVGTYSRRWAMLSGKYASFIATYSRLGMELRVFGAAPEVEREAAKLAGTVAATWSKNRVLQRATPVAFRTLVLTVAFAGLGMVAALAPAQIVPIAVISLLLVRALAHIQSLQQIGQMLKEMSAFADSVERASLEFEPDTSLLGRKSLRHIRTLALRGVSFSYDNERPQVRRVTMELERGHLVSIVGRSGGGKSTLLRLLLGTMVPQEGSVQVNDEPISTFRREDWFRCVAYLPQEARLIPGTIADNVRFFRRATDEQVDSAIRRAALDLSFDTFPLGISSPVSEEGTNLSGGQRQRIGLARCLLLDPEVLLLDEPTSALDPAAEQAIMRTINDLRTQMIIVMVTHRDAVSTTSEIKYTMTDGSLEKAKPTSASSSRRPELGTLGE